ncbi:MAG TPA: hypothetical protein VMV87_06940 [Burkholderiales bacterium]|nr:hypothetical protein [Burkholderiales bacterium]
MKTLLKPIGISILVLFAALASGTAMADRDGHDYGRGDVHGHDRGDGHRYDHGDDRGYGHDHDRREHGHVRFGLTLGAPLFAPDYYAPYDNPYPAYSYPPVVVQSAPPVYIEQGAAQAAPAPAYWYYCAASQSYYPYVSACPAGWQRVPAQPPR